MTGAEYSALYRNAPERAYKALFDEYCNYVYAVVYNKLSSAASREDIEECVSDIFADIYFNYDISTEYQGDMKGYVSTVALRRAINKYHSLTAKASHYEDADDERLGRIRSEEDVEAESEKSEVQNIIMGAINELGEPDSTILIQKYYYDRTSKEIAQQLSMKSSAVRMRCGRAMSRLRQYLEAAGISL